MIRILDKHVADKIAAGEVIDRPVSIVKELLENALDAGASHITVEIKNGGKSYIRVTDNGCGIPSDETEIAFKRHATSKISSAEDLDAIGTLGFRGEALASICAVARVELITKTQEGKTGRRVLAEDSDMVENTAIGCPEGTTVTVRDLFYNVPARSKFLASDSAETRRIVDMVSRIAISYGDVKFSLINGSSRVFSTSGKGNIRNNLVSIYGADAVKDLIPVEKTGGGFILKGFVSAPSYSVPSRSRQIFCVNGRVVYSRTMEKALEDAYKEKLFHGRFPAAYLFLAVPPEKLDVNVHPTKKEIRFDDPFEISDFITDAIKPVLMGKEAMPEIRSENLFVSAPQPVYLAEEKKQPKIPVKEEQVDIKNILTTLRREPAFEAPAEENPQEEESKTWEAPEALRPQESLFRPFAFEALDYMGTLFNTYIMASDADSFYLIDQHAAHERVFYERLLEEYNRSEKLRQTLLIPLRFSVSAQVAASEGIWLSKVCDLGYDIAYFGANTYLVREIPAFMDMEEAEGFLSDLFNALEDDPDLTNQRTLERIIIQACKSAVKGGDALAQEEIHALIKDLKGCANPFSCPHGRPTFIRMKKYEIEKQFKRV